MANYNWSCVVNKTAVFIRVKESIYDTIDTFLQQWNQIFLVRQIIYNALNMSLEGWWSMTEHRDLLFDSVYRVY